MVQAAISIESYVCVYLFIYVYVNIKRGRGWARTCDYANDNWRKKEIRGLKSRKTARLQVIINSC